MIFCFDFASPALASWSRKSFSLTNNSRSDNDMYDHMNNSIYYFLYVKPYSSF